MKRLILALVLLPMMAVIAGAWAVSHAAPLRVADGDTIAFGGQKIRLQGIDAPELHQECRDASGRNWPCGRRARSELRKIIGNDSVQCEPHAKDRFGRAVAVCRAGGRDLGEAMVRSGWALAYPDRSSPYGAAQSDARSRKAGIWAGSFANPRAWRDEHPRDDLPPIGSRAGDIIPAAAQEWLRDHSQAARRSLLGWVRSFWAGKPENR